MVGAADEYKSGTMSKMMTDPATLEMSPADQGSYLFHNYALMKGTLQLCLALADAHNLRLCTYKLRFVTTRGEYLID